MGIESYSIDFSQAFEVEVSIIFLLTIHDSCSKFSNHIELEKTD